MGTLYCRSHLKIKERNLNIYKHKQHFEKPNNLCQCTLCDSSNHNNVYSEDENVNFPEVIFRGATTCNYYTKAGS